jgi:hypothetical protein
MPIRFVDQAAGLALLASILAGVAVMDDVQAGLAEYVRLRDSWDAPLGRLAGLLGYTPEQVDVTM